MDALVRARAKIELLMSEATDAIATQVGLSTVPKLCRDVALLVALYSREGSFCVEDQHSKGVRNRPLLHPRQGHGLRHNPPQ